MLNLVARVVLKVTMKVFSLVFFCLLCIGTSSGSVRKVLLNDLLVKKGRFPLHDTVYKGSPVLYCYRGLDRASVEGIQSIWTGIEIKIYEFNKLMIIVGNSTESTEKSLMTIGNYDVKEDKFGLVWGPYDHQCMGLKCVGSERDAGLTLDVKSRVLLHLPVLLMVGLSLFYAAHTLSRSVALYYGGGVAVGVIASVLILLYIFSKFVPKKNILGLGIFAGGWAIFGTALYWFLDHLADAVQEYWIYVVIYIVVAAVISFALLYRVGPITNPRTFDLIEWSIQLVGLVMVYFSTQMWQFSVSICALVVLLQVLPRRCNPVYLPFLLLYILLYPLIVCLSNLNPFTWFSGPPRIKLLTQEEYEEQGRVETENALQELRMHCQELPTKKMVTIMSRLKNSSRMSSFLTGNDHITTEEQVTHDWEHNMDSDSSDENSEMERSGHNSSANSSHHSFSESPQKHTPSPQRRPYPSPGRQGAPLSSSRLKYRTPNVYHTMY